MDVKKKVTWFGLIPLLSLVLSLAVVTSPVMGAQDATLNIKSMKISVWPEYDDPRILVTYQGEFNSTPSFPQPVKFPVPTGTEINQVCALQPPNNEHLCQLYDTLTEAEGLSISYTLPIPTYYLEYYWDGIKAEAGKNFTFNYVSPYAIDKLEIDVQQPLKATDFKLTQPYVTASSDGRGMKYYNYVFNNVAPGQAITIDASYTKPDNTPSVAKKAITQTGSAGGASGSSSYGIIGIGGGILAVVVIGMMLLKRKPAPVATRAEYRRAARIEAKRTGVQRAEPLQGQRPPAPRAAPARPVPAAAKVQPSAGAAFCSHCGTRLVQGAVFCHACGEDVKTA